MNTIFKILRLCMIFIVAVILNYIWEVAQSPFYKEMKNFKLVWWHCFISSLGDGIIIIIYYLIGWIIFKKYIWFYFLLLFSGFQRNGA